MTSAPPLRVVSATQHPHEVAAAAADYASRCAVDPRIRAVVLTVLGRRGAGQVRDARGDLVPEALLRWARTLSFIREPGRGGEFLSAPWVTLAAGGGDCDDVTVAVTSIARAVGLSAAVLCFWTGANVAHVLPVVGRDWVSATAPALVVDADASKLWTLDAPRFQGARLFPVS